MIFGQKFKIKITTTKTLNELYYSVMLVIAQGLKIPSRKVSQIRLIV